MKDGMFREVGFGSALRLPWADTPHEEGYTKKDVARDLPLYFDVFSTDEERNIVDVKWRPAMSANDHLFVDAGTYRITTKVIAADGAAASKQITFEWNGSWDNVVFLD